MCDSYKLYRFQLFIFILLPRGNILKWTKVRIKRNVKFYLNFPVWRKWREIPTPSKFAVLFGRWFRFRGVLSSWPAGIFAWKATRAAAVAARNDESWWERSQPPGNVQSVPLWSGNKRSEANKLLTNLLACSTQGTKGLIDATVGMFHNSDAPLTRFLLYWFLPLTWRNPCHLQFTHTVQKPEKMNNSRAKSYN